jgi:hypothetical protein
MAAMIFKVPPQWGLFGLDALDLARSDDYTTPLQRIPLAIHA